MGAIVCAPGANKEFFDFWTTFLVSGEPHIPTPLLCPTIGAACEGLGLPAGACEVLERAVATPQGDGERPADGQNATPPNLSR